MDSSVRLDQFYTSISIAKLCIDSILRLGLPDFYLEPSAGTGAFSSHLPGCKAYDIEPKAEGIIKADFLTLDIPPEWSKMNIFTVGNPPFGRQNSLARKFIKKSAEFSSMIAFILPRSFRKVSLQKSFPLCFHLVESFDIQKDSFVFEGKTKNVPCVFQIWKKMKEDRLVEGKFTTSDFIFVKKAEFPDIAVRRVGSKAGLVTKDIFDCNPRCFYFAKLSIPVDVFIRRMNRIVWEENTVGPRSISKPELISGYLATLGSVTSAGSDSGSDISSSES